MIIKDDYDGEFCYAGRPMPTLKSVDRSGRVIYVGTFGETKFPALRLGFFLAPDHLVDVFGRVASAYLQGVPANPQAVVADFIEAGQFASHIGRMCQIYAERFKVLYEAAGEMLAGRLDIMPTDTGPHTIGLLADRFTEVDVSAAAEARRTTIAPIDRFCMEPIAVKACFWASAASSRKRSPPASIPWRRCLTIWTPLRHARPAGNRRRYPMALSPRSLSEYCSRAAPRFQGRGLGRCRAALPGASQAVPDDALRP